MVQKKSDFQSMTNPFESQGAPPPYSLSTGHANVSTNYRNTSFLARRLSKFGKVFVRKETSPEALEVILKPILEKFDIVFIVDDSGSMQGKRWNEVCLEKYQKGVLKSDLYP
jgi:hypothetical protein